MFNFSKFFLLFNKFLLIFLFLAKLSLSYADQLKIEKVKINGTQRISNSFILNFFPEYPNTNFNNEVLNKFTKDLYNSGMFNKVSLKVDNNTLLINVEEYPVINEISFTGNDLLENETLSNIISIKSILKDETFFKGIGREYGRLNITSHIIRMGAFDGKMLHDLGDNYIKSVKKKISLGREGTPDELSNAIKFCEENPYTNNGIIEINGGLNIDL